MRATHTPLRRSVLAVAAAVLAAATLTSSPARSSAEAGHAAVLVVPIVLSSGGAGGSYYTSELVLTNRGTTAASLALLYTAAFGDGSGSCSETLAAGEQKIVPDAIGWLRERGVPIPEGAGRGGTLRVSFSGLSAPDAAAVTVRTTTATAAPQPEGAAGLAYPAVPPESSFTSSATIYGLRATADDRSNVAVYNPSSSPVTVRVTASSGDGSGNAVVKEEGLEIAPLGWTQLSSVFDGTGITNGWVTVERTGGAGSFGAYGVVNDNGTSDGSFVLPVGGALAGSSITVPVLVETTSGYSSELVLANRSETVAILTLVYVEGLSPAGGAGGFFAFELDPKTQLILPDALDWLRGKGIVLGAKGEASHAGALHVSVAGTTLENVFAGARTAAQSPSRGQFGLFTPGIYEGEEASSEAWLYGLRADSLNRTNVAVVNAGAAGSGKLTLVLQAFDAGAGGLPKGAPETTELREGEWAQLSGFLGERGVQNGWIGVTRTSGEGPWLAYAVVNDGGSPGHRTGDGAYVPMQKVDITSSHGLDILLVAGGAGGGSAGDRAGGGGGGGGGVVHLVQGSWPTSPLEIRVGRGGTSNEAGSDSSVSGEGYVLTALGGGSGGRDYSNNAYGRTGGSGGGGGSDSKGRQTGGASSQIGAAQTFPAGRLGQFGQPGGRGSFDPDGCGGGGGAGAAGEDGYRDPSGAGVGGAGGAGVLLDIAGAPVHYGAGGGGSGPGKYNVGRGGTGGEGGGGAGSQDVDGSPGSGWGAGGGGAGMSKAGGSGHQGIVVLRYRGEQKATGGDVSQVGGYTIHRFTSDGTFFPDAPSSSTAGSQGEKR